MTRPFLDRVPSPLLAVAAIVSVQFGAALARTHFDALGPTGAAALRLAFGALILVVVVRPRVRGWSRRTWRGVVLLGLALAGMNSLIYLAIDVVPLGVAVTLEFLGPLVVALAQTRRWSDAAWALLALVGVVVLGLDSSGATPVLGILLALGAGAFWAAYIVANASLGRSGDGIAGLAVSMVVAAVVVVPFGAADATRAVTADPSLLAVFALVALLTSALPYSLEMVALRRLPTRVFGVLSSLGPAVAAVAGLVVLGQALGLRELVALACVTAASVGVTVASGRARAARGVGQPPAARGPTADDVRRRTTAHGELPCPPLGRPTSVASPDLTGKRQVDGRQPAAFVPRLRGTLGTRASDGGAPETGRTPWELFWNERHEPRSCPSGTVSTASRRPPPA